MIVHVDVLPLLLRFKTRDIQYYGGYYGGYFLRRKTIPTQN
jgi:hypothetical protein